MLLEVGVLSGIFFLCIILYVLSQNVRGPFALPIIGLIRYPDIALKLHVYHAKFSRMYPTPYKFWLGLHPSYVFGDAEGVRRVLLTQLHKYDRNPLVYKAFDPVATGLILMPNGEQWKHDRKMFDVAFKYENIKKLQPLVLSHYEILERKLEKFAQTGEVVDIQELFQAFTFDVIGQMTFGFNFQTQEKPELGTGNLWVSVLETMFWKLVIPIPYWKIYKTEYIKGGENACKELIQRISKIINDRKTEPIEDDDPTLLACILRENQKHDGVLYQDIQILRHMLTFLFAGHDTTVNILCWVFYYLNMHPDVAERLRQEIDETLEGRRVTFADLNNLPYLSNVVKETLRLKPSAPVQARKLTEDDEFNGMKMKKGSFAGYSAYAVHRDPKEWPDPEKFDPERFTPENSKDRHQYAFVPFGAGPRICLGEKLAYVEIKTTLVCILQNFDFRLAPNQEIEDVLKTTMFIKNGIKMYISKRELRK